MATITAIEQHDIDPNYNCEVVLKLQSEEHLYRVSHSALRLASPVFAKTLDPKSPWAKQEDNGVIKITLRDNDPEALEILFKLMHFQQKSIPKNLALKTIFKLGLICDQYDCVHIAKPLVQELAVDLAEAENDKFWNRFYSYSFSYAPETEDDGVSQTLGDGTATTAYMLLYISYIFDFEKIFPKAYKTSLLIWKPASVSDDSDEFARNLTCLPDGLYQRFMEDWEGKRNAMIKPTVDFLHKFTFGLVYGKQGKCLKDPNCTICEISMYGSFIRRLSYKGIFPIQEKSEELSLYELGKRLGSIQIGSYWDENNEVLVPHAQCKRELLRAVRFGVGEGMKIEAVKLKDFKEYLEMRRTLLVSDETGSDGVSSGAAIVSEG
ncbi:hypothetical protein ABW19_dt0207202 [Dactylella cylindrospora]|nr:hypothetical protein ABW19_dt0207202 [Dactylella cylindrospora]